MDEARAYDRVAKFYDTLTFFVEWFVSKHRKEILKLVEGQILEVGVGTGNSFKDYPSYNRFVPFNESGEMLQRAANKLNGYEGDLELLLADMEYLPFKDEVFDTVFTSLVLCSVVNPVRKLKDMKRVAKMNGKLLMVEHVKSKNKFLGYLMEKLNPLLAPLDNINRDTVKNLKEASWTVKQERNLAYDIFKAIVAEKQ